MNIIYHKGIFRALKEGKASDKVVENSSIKKSGLINSGILNIYWPPNASLLTAIVLSY
jgi:hypothetical protein